MSIIKFCNNKCCSFEIKNYTKIDFIPISKKKLVCSFLIFKIIKSF